MFFTDNNASIHWELPQLKSQREALTMKESAITWISEDEFQYNGHGKDPYVVSIGRCTCQDFLQNKKGQAPCKHIYWLAMKKGLFSLPELSEERQEEAEIEIAARLEHWKQVYLSGGISISRYIAILEAMKTKSGKEAKSKKNAVEQNSENPPMPVISQNSPLQSSDIQNEDSLLSPLTINEFPVTVQELKERADSLLVRFLSNYYSVVLSSGTFSDIDAMSSSISECLFSYDQYFRLNLYERCGVNPSEYIKVFSGERYEHFMDSRKKLEDHLLSFQSAMETEKRRKEALESEMIAILSRNTEYPVLDLLSRFYQSYPKSEVEYCYGALKRNNRVVERKHGEIRFARLSLIEKGEYDANFPHPSRKKQPLAIKKPITKSELIAFLKSENVTFIDKTASGGCFWVFGSPAVDSFMRGVTVDGVNPGYSKNAKTLSYRPGWFMKLCSSEKDEHDLIVNPKTDYTKEEVIQFLSVRGKTYCDNTSSGGNFWIMCDSEIEEWINGKTIEGKVPAHTSSAGALHGAPGWYV